MPEPAAKAPCFGHRAFLGPKLDEVEGAGAGAGSHLAFCSRSPNGEHRSTKALFSNEVASLPYLCIYIYHTISSLHIGPEVPSQLQSLYRITCRPGSK